MMGARFILAGVVLCSAMGCSSSKSDDVVDAGGHSPIEGGTVGSHVWFSSSVGLELRESWFHDTWGADAAAPAGGSRCWALERGALTDAQLAALEGLVLVPLAGICTADGDDYFQLTVMDENGSSAAYRDTGCSYLRLPDAKAMLPKGAFGPFPPETASACPD